MAESKAIIKAMLIGIDFCWRRRGRGLKVLKILYQYIQAEKKMVVDKFHFAYAKILVSEVIEIFSKFSS